MVTLKELAVVYHYHLHFVLLMTLSPDVSLPLTVAEETCTPQCFDTSISSNVREALSTSQESTKVTPQRAQTSFPPYASEEPTTCTLTLANNTPQHNNKLLQPVNLFPNTQPSDRECIRKEQNVAINVRCSIDQIANSNENKALQTKAANLLYEVIGQNPSLTRFDQLRQKLKQVQLKKQKPTRSDRAEYETVTAKLQNTLLSCKYTTKNALKSMEKEYLANNKKPDLEYNTLRKKLELVKKILSIWSQFI